MYPVRLLVAAGVLAFVASLVALAPLSWLLRLAPASVAERVSSPTGTLWQGAAQLRLADGPVLVSWDSHPIRLLLLQASADWQVRGKGLTGEGRAAFAPWGNRLQVARAEIDAGRLRQLLAGSRLTADQPLTVHELDLRLAAGKRVKDAGGRLAWGPGTVTITGRPEPLALPALRGALRAVDGKLQLVVDGESEPGGMLATLEVDPAGGQLHLLVSQRAARLAGVAATATRGPDEAFFEARQPLR